MNQRIQKGSSVSLNVVEVLEFIYLILFFLNSSLEKGGASPLITQLR